MSTPTEYDKLTQKLAWVKRERNAWKSLAEDRLAEINELKDRLRLLEAGR